MGPRKSTNTKKGSPEKKGPNSLNMLMRGEKRRAAARSHGDIWQEHRKPARKSQTESGKQKKKSAEKKAAEETGGDDAFEVLQAEQKQKSSKRKTKEPFTADEKPKKRARKETQQKVESGEKGEQTSEKAGQQKEADAAKPESATDGSSAGASKEAVEGVVTINRAPTLTLWVATVAKREGYAPEEGLTFGKYVAGVFAHSKGKSLGLIESDPDKEAQAKEKKKEQRRGLNKVPVFGMDVWVKKTAEGQVSALDPNGKPIEPQTVKAYLHRAFKNKLEDAQKAMEALAAAFPPEEVGKKAYQLYEQFRPTVPQGARGWGGKGELDLDLISRKLVQDASGG